MLDVIVKRGVVVDVASASGRWRELLGPLTRVCDLGAGERRGVWRGEAADPRRQVGVGHLIRVIALKN